ncbi:hypothetical protein [Xanthomonas sp. 1678]|uniref:hypothetical protein n=1 Tax=Xanthomonas sp. 1678 TaxID=3158788 RepID=UPI0028578379|nr:hypothetical protein [Xanthomonas translucens]
MKKRSLPPLVGGFADGKVTWQRLEAIDYETLGYLLSCHLIIEHYLDHFIATYTKAPFSWESAKLTFGQKISLISKVPFPEPYNLPPTIKHLNSLRNKFSHNISTRLTEEDLLPFQQFLEKCSKGQRADIPNDAREMLDFYTTIVCAYFASSISHAAQFLQPKAE